MQYSYKLDAYDDLLRSWLALTESDLAILDVRLSKAAADLADGVDGRGCDVTLDHRHWHSVSSAHLNPTLKKLPSEPAFRDRTTPRPLPGHLEKAMQHELYIDLETSEEGPVASVLLLRERKPFMKSTKVSWSQTMQSDWFDLREVLLDIIVAQDRQSDDFRSKDSMDILFDLVGSITDAMEMQDSYVSLHQSSVADMAEKIGVRLGLRPERVVGLKLAAQVHDIGKISIPPSILTKSGSLDKFEFDLVKTHSEAGEAVFSGVDLPWPISTIIRQHHERLDGTGYPDGLIGDEICIEARIIAVADTFDAMANDRPYRPALPILHCLQTLIKGVDIHYDRNVVCALFSVLEDDGLLD